MLPLSRMREQTAAMQQLSEKPSSVEFSAAGTPEAQQAWPVPPSSQRTLAFAGQGRGPCAALLFSANSLALFFNDPLGH